LRGSREEVSKEFRGWGGKIVGGAKHYYIVLRQTIFTVMLNIKCPAALYCIKLYCI